MKLSKITEQELQEELGDVSLSLMLCSDLDLDPGSVIIKSHPQRREIPGGQSSRAT